MSLHLQAFSPIPEEMVRIARAAYPKVSFVAILRSGSLLVKAL